LDHATTVDVLELVNTVDVLELVMQSMPGAAIDGLGMNWWLVVAICMPSHQTQKSQLGMMTLMTIILCCMGYIQPSHLPFFELAKFVICVNFSIVGMNVSLKWNSVGFYQVRLIHFLSLFFCPFVCK
jgi:hypothetical protein